MRLLALSWSILLLLSGPATAVAPTTDLHDLEWFVHIDLIDVPAGKDLAFYQALIDDAMVQSSNQLKGNQGPADTPCCTELTRTVSMTTEPS